MRAAVEPCSVEPVSEAAPDFLAAYDAHASLVFRAARRLGVPDASVDDVVQDVFVVVHRRLADFEARSSMRRWIYGITVKVVQDFRRGTRRRLSRIEGREQIDDLAIDPHDPERSLAQKQAVAKLHALLDALDDDKRTVFVLAELESLSAPEIAEIVGIPMNTVYSRLRAARRAFSEAVARLREDERREP
ncbi:MAG: RNA polymerase sigma factor [Polyangiales bacterium]